jgi:hypothetical protein
MEKLREKKGKEEENHKKIKNKNKKWKILI